MVGGDTTGPSHYFDDHRPRYHVQPPKGWVNDPNGPVFYKGRYHMFYQHLPEKCEWDFGIVWGHAVSSDLVHWEHLPPALVPTDGWVDADGCFSGCCVIDSLGRPIILYTGVRLRSNTVTDSLPPPEQDLGMVWIESQCAAVPADPNDDLLVSWKKVEAPFLPLPPADMQLTGWRDPFLITVNPNLSGGACASPATFGQAEEPQYRILMGSGIKGKGGTALVYRSSSLMDGWELEGTLCEGCSEDTGVVWECPLLVPLIPVPHQQRSRHRHTPPPWLVAGPMASSAEKKAAGAVTAAEGLDGISPSILFSNLRNSSLASTASGTPAKLAPVAEQEFEFSSPSKTPKKGGGAAAAAEAASPAQKARHGGGAAGSFEFGSGGGTSPAELARAGSVEMIWPSSGNTAGTPAGDEEGEEGKVSSGELAVEELAIKLERAATLEHWNPDDLNIEQERNGGSRGSGSSESVTTCDRQATIGSFVPNENSASGEAAASESSGEGTASLSATQLDRVSSANIENDTTAAAAVTARRVPSSCWSHHHPPPGDEAGRENDGGVVADLEDLEDRFAMAFSRVPALQVRPTKGIESSRDPGELLETMSIYSDANLLSSTAPARQWHFFTVSPDAPTNPVLYWTGFVSGHDSCEDGEMAAGPPRFEIETAKGPFRLDLGDVLYAPNVCQDDTGRWLLWGWLQERRKVGTYAYAGCLSLPRVLFHTDEGRLVQAPAPEVAQLRQGQEWHAQHVTLYPEAVIPLQHMSGGRLDIEVTIERGSALAAGLLFRSHEAEAEGSTAIVYDWDRNQLEAIFNVPPNWQPCMVQVPPGAGQDVFDGVEVEFDAAAYLCNTPRYPLSRTPSVVFSPGDASPHPGGGGGLLSPQSTSSIDSQLGSSLPFASLPIGMPIQRTGSSLSQCLQRTGSLAALGTSLGGLSAAAAGPGGGGGGPPGGLARSQTMGTSLRREASLGSLRRTASFMAGTPMSHPRDDGDPLDGDMDLATLLEDLAAPMRGAAEEGVPQQVVEPRRVGGPLLMGPSDRLHLRIIVDHSCVEVFAGTGEVLSTRIYRGQGPDPSDPGIDFVAFGGAAILERVDAYEVGSAWADLTPAATPGTARSQHTQHGGAVSTPGSAHAAAEALFDEIIMNFSADDLTSMAQTTAVA